MKTEFKHKESMIARLSIGGGFSHRHSAKKTEKVFMVVGATGSGKTSLINGMVNYILGVERKDDFRYKVTAEDKTMSQGQCQTKGITAYTFYPMDCSTVPYTFTIIDTPGFGDSEELGKDTTIRRQIKEFLSMSPPEGIDHLDGIGFVTQASFARLTPRQEYIFDFILSMFGKDVVKNIFTMVTFADCQSVPPVMEVINKTNIPSQKYYKFNNLVFYADNAEETEEMSNGVLWKMSVSSFKALFSEIENLESVSLQLTEEVLKESEHVRVLIRQLDQKITLDLSKTEELRQEELAISSKSQTECTIKQPTEDIKRVETEVNTMKNQIQQILCRLDEIALKPSPLMQWQYLERLIETEKREANPGWMQRVQYYEEAKRLAEICHSGKHVDAGQDLIKETPSSGDKWYPLSNSNCKIH